MTDRNPRLWPGFFLTIDGPGGVGKSTAVERIATRLLADGAPVHRTTEPSRGPIGELARSGTHTYNGHALACLVAADRYHHLSTEVRPALGAGRLVVCDRYVASSLVLQRRDGVPVPFIEAINAAADRPDLAVILIAEPEVIRARLKQRSHSHGRFEDDEAVDTELGYYRDAAAWLLTAGVHTVTIDTGSQEPDRLARTIVEAVRERWATVTGSANHNPEKP